MRDAYGVSYAGPARSGVTGIFPAIASDFYPTCDVEGSRGHCYNQGRSARVRQRAGSFGSESRNNRREANDSRGPRWTRVSKRGQVAQVVERSPEKAGVGGSTPSLATIIPKNLTEIW
jgi:hypothetical protein